MRKSEYKKPVRIKWASNLTIRSQNCIANIGIASKEELQRAIMDGVFWPGSVRNFGFISLMEVCDWVEIPIKIWKKTERKTEPLRTDISYWPDGLADKVLSEGRHKVVTHLKLSPL